MNEWCKNTGGAFVAVRVEGFCVEDEDEGDEGEEGDEGDEVVVVVVGGVALVGVVSSKLLHIQDDEWMNEWMNEWLRRIRTLLSSSLRKSNPSDWSANNQGRSQDNN